jgi:hypothetical protein
MFLKIQLFARRLVRMAPFSPLNVRGAAVRRDFLLPAWRVLGWMNPGTTMRRPVRIVIREGCMTRRAILMAACVALVVPAATPGRAQTQQKTIKEQLIGSWKFSSSIDVRRSGRRVNRWGPNPAGIFIFDAGGHYAQMIMRTDVRAFGAKTVASFGTYVVNEATKTIITHMEGSSIPSFIGSDEKRVIISLTADELKYNNPSTSAGTSVVAIWKRAK